MRVPPTFFFYYDPHEWLGVVYLQQIWGVWMNKINLAASSLITVIYSKRQVVLVKRLG